MFIKKILCETLSYGIENKAIIFSTLKYPSLGILITSFLFNKNANVFEIEYIIIMLFNVYFYMIFTIHCHQLFLGWKTPNSIIDIFKWDKRKTNFLISSTALALGAIISFVPVFFIFILFGSLISEQFNFLIFLIILALPIGYVFSRFSLVLPATAIEDENSWSIAWDISRGNGWNLCLLVSVLPLLSGFIIDTIDSTSWIVKILTSTLSLVVLFFEVSILSNSYKVLVAEKQKT